MKQTDVDNWTTVIRVRAGNPTVNDVPDPMITEAVTAALVEYGGYRGPEMVQISQTQEDVQVYTVDPEFVKLSEVVWGDDIDVRGDIFLRAEAFSPFDFLAGHDTFKNPSIVTIVYQQLEAFRKHFAGKWEPFDSPSGGALQIMISPPPWINQPMAIIGRTSSTLANVPDRDREVLVAACLWKLNEMRYQSMAMVSSVSTGGGSINFGTANFKEIAEAQKKIFERKVGANLPAFMYG